MTTAVKQTHTHVLVGMFIMMGSAIAMGQSATPSHYYHFDQKVALTCDTTQVAAFGRTAPQLTAATVRPSPLSNMYFADTANLTRDEKGVAVLVADVAADQDVDFASPVFLDDIGEPVIMTQHLHVGFQDDVGPAEAEDLLAKFGAGVIEERDWAGMSNVYRLKSEARDGFEVLDIANRLAELPEVRFAEPDMIMTYRKSLIPDDPYFPSQWGLHNTGQSGGTVDMDLDGPEAWDISIGSSDIITVIIDDGIQQDHPDINQIAGRDFTSAGTDGGPGNACDDHGTTVGGCTSALINNALGVVGIAPGTKVASAKYSISNVPCDGSGYFYISWFVNALDWAQTIGARVTNCSSGFGVNSSVTSKYQETYNAGIVHFSSSGNSGGSGIGYPASLPTVNAVGAINRYGNRAYFSTYGTGIAFVAPGQQVWTTDRTGGDGYSGADYAMVDGTSYSSPYAAGVAAMVLSVDDTLTPAEVTQIMNDTSVDRGAAGYDIYYGWGILNAHAAMLAASPGVLLEGECFYDVAMQEPVDTVAVEVFNLDTGAGWTADTTDNYYSLTLLPVDDISANDTLRLIAKDGGNWINVTDHLVTQGEIDAASIYLDLILDEFYLDLTDFPMYEADSPEDQMSGPAVAQMVLNYMFWDSDTDPTLPMTFDDQQVLYDYGIPFNETPGLDYLDMLGMWHSIQDNKPGPYSQYGYNFTRRHDTDSGEILKQIAQWIAYPVGTVSGGHEEGHPLNVPGVIPAYGNYTNWLAVRGIHTSDNAYPLPPDLDVYGFWINDPYPAVLGGIGENSYKTVDELLATYYLPMSTGDSYDGEYVAICEPPETDGDEKLWHVASPERFTPYAKALITAVRTLDAPPAELVDAANVWIVQAAVDGVSEQLVPYDANFARRFRGTTAGTPLFVSNDLGDDYYAVPFDSAAVKSELAADTGGTVAVVLVDAEDGAFKEASWVATPVEYLPVSESDAIQIAYEGLVKLRIDPRLVKTARIGLAHLASTPYYPHWRIETEKFELLIGQDGSFTLVE